MTGAVFQFGWVMTQLTSGALSWPELVVTASGGTDSPTPLGPLTRCSEMVPAGEPAPLFQWYVAAE